MFLAKSECQTLSIWVCRRNDIIPTCKYTETHTLTSCCYQRQDQPPYPIFSILPSFWLVTLVFPTQLFRLFSAQIKMHYYFFFYICFNIYANLFLLPQSSLQGAIVTQQDGIITHAWCTFLTVPPFPSCFPSNKNLFSAILPTPQTSTPAPCHIPSANQSGCILHTSRGCKAPQQHLSCRGGGVL